MPWFVVRHAIRSIEWYEGLLTNVVYKKILAS